MIRHESTGSIVEPAGRNPGLRWARLVTGLLVGSLPGLCAASADHQPPSAPGSLVAHAIGITELTLEWSAASDNVRVTAYEVSQDGCVAGTTSGLSRHVTALDPGSSHQFAVRARDAAGNWSVPSAPITVTTLTDVTPPTIPGGLAAGDVTLQGFQLTWAASADDVKVTGYEIFRNGESVATTVGRSHRVGGLAPGTNSRMAVRARDAAGNWSGRSEELAVSTLADTTPPSRPAELCAAGVGTTRLTLRWEPAKDNVRVTAYEDSYAHQRGQMDRDGEPYGPVFGHLFAGFTPDRTDARPELADRMAERTYQQLRSFFDQTHAQKSCDDWANILPVVDHWARIEK